MQLFVLGMHRSGTSTVSRILNLMGIYFGAEGSSEEPNDDNRKGFWERKDVNRINDYILKENDHSWFKISNVNIRNNFTDESTVHFNKVVRKLILDIDGFRPWFIKDPRLCLTLPLWKSFTEVPVGIYVYRNPLEVAQSLQHRNGFPLEYGLLLWEKYNLLALKNSKDFPLHFINYNELIESPKKVINKLSKFLKDRKIPVRDLNPKELEKFIEPSLYRQRANDNYEHFISKSQSALYKSLVSEKINISLDKSLSALDNGSLAKYEAHFVKLFGYEHTKKQNEKLEELQEQLKNTIEVKSSENVNLKEALDKHIETLKAKNEQIKSQFNTIDKKVDDLKSKNEQLHSKDSELSSTQKLLQAKENQLKDKIELIKAKDDIITSKENIERDIKINLLEYQHQVFKRDQLTTDLKSKLETKTSRIIELDKQIGVINQKVADLQNKLASEAAQTNSLQSKNKALEIKLRDIQSQKNAKEASLTGEVKRLKQAQENKDKLISTYWDQIQAMRLSSRLKRILKLGFLITGLISIKSKIKSYFINRKVRKQLVKEQNKLNQFVRNSFDHSLSSELPLVSIIILNRDGLTHLKTLFENWKNNTIYSNYEIIVFDNESKDNSISYLNSLKAFDIKVIKNNYNASFSEANNIASRSAKGELLLFLNNDVDPFYGWLNQLVKTYFKYKDNIGLVGAKLLYPYKENEAASLKVQHAGIAFRIEEGFVRPYNLDNNKNFFDLNYTEDIKRPSMTAACVLVSKDKFNRVNGFDDKYVFGYEDVDLGLKLAKAGYCNRLAKGAVLFHHEFGTQSVQNSKEVGERRRRNLEHFRNKWYKYLLIEQWNEMLNGEESKYFGERNVNVGIIVTEQGDHAVAGDFFTAKELANEFTNLNWNVKYFAQREGNFYNIDENIDVLIVLLHGYDLNKITTKNANLIKIAWLRNWFEKFADNPGFELYDLVFASSKKACDYILNEKGKYAHYLPIATNQAIFEEKQDVDSKFECDYCFTGSYWNDPREIIDMLDPKSLPDYKFNIYGKNWEEVDKLQEYSQGFVEYDDMPKIYGNTKLLIDDANRVTKPWGSVNSRVFDAIMAGVLVITNGRLGSKDVFNGQLPHYETKEELNTLIADYLGNDKKRKSKVKELKEIVLKNHTYKHRAESIKTVLSTYYENNMLIKMPVPNKEVAHNWGDYHFAKSLKKEFERQKIRTRIQFLKDWEHPASFAFKNVLVLRGLSKHTPRPFQNTMMWNISHPDKVSLDEYKSYNHVFVASEKWTEQLQAEGLTNVSTLLQCTDPDVFKIPKKTEKVENELLFVGNSRGVYRKIIKDLLPTKYDLAVYGGGWKGLLDDEYVKGEHIDNKELYKYYGGAKVLLNDHWDDMREKGFISNRIFDALACGSFVVSDNIEGLDFAPDFVKCYSSKKQLNASIKKKVSDKACDKKTANNMRKYIIKNHTFKVRAHQIVNKLKMLRSIFIFLVMLTLTEANAQNWELFRLDHINYYFTENENTGVIVDAGLKRILFTYDYDKLGFHYEGSYSGERDEWVRQKCGAKKRWEDNAFGFKGHFTSLDSIRNNGDFTTVLYSRIPVGEGYTGCESGEFKIKRDCKLNDVWELTNGVNVKCTNILKENIFGVSDSVKVMKSIDENIEIKISKRFGLLSFTDFLTDNSIKFNLAGIQGDDIKVGFKPGIKHFSDMAPGDLFLRHGLRIRHDNSPTDTIRLFYELDSVMEVNKYETSVEYKVLRKRNYRDSSNIKEVETTISVGKPPLINVASMIGTFTGGEDLKIYSPIFYEINNGDTLLGFEQYNGFDQSTSKSKGKIGGYYYSYFNEVDKGHYNIEAYKIDGQVYGNLDFPKYPLVPVDTVGPILAINHLPLSQENFLVYPNPSYDVLFIEGFENSSFDFTIYNLKGKLIMKGQCKSTIDINALSDDVYILKLENGGTTLETTFIKGQ